MEKATFATDKMQFNRQRFMMFATVDFQLFSATKKRSFNNTIALTDEHKFNLSIIQKIESLLLLLLTG